MPRVGLQLGTWAGTLRTEIHDGAGDFTAKSDASGGIGAVLGAEALFRMRFGLRLGGGVLVMPALSFKYDSSFDGTSRSFTAGTVIRVPAVLEWEFPLTDRFSIVPGIIPSVLILVRGSQAKNRPTRQCFLQDCESLDMGEGGFAVEGELGAMWWIGSQALRADLRFGIESLETVSADGHVIVETLTGARMTLWLGFEI